MEPKNGKRLKTEPRHDPDAPTKSTCCLNRKLHYASQKSQDLLGFFSNQRTIFPSRRSQNGEEEKSPVAKIPLCPVELIIRRHMSCKRGAVFVAKKEWRKVFV